MPRARGYDPDITRYPALDIRPDFRKVAPRLILILGIAWVGAFFLYVFGTDPGRVVLGERGFLPAFLGWVVMAALIIAGDVGFYRLLRSISRGKREYAEKDVVALAFLDSIMSAIGAIGVAFVLFIVSSEVLVLLSWAAVLSVLFGTAALTPLYVAGWRERDARRGRR